MIESRLKTALSVGLIAGLALSPRLWLTARTYPLTPVSRLLPAIPPLFDWAVYGAMLVLLAWIAIARRPVKALGAFLAIAIAYALFDQSRWQPWFYQYIAMLAVLWFFRATPEEALPVCRFIIAAVYFWSGAHKFNSGFVHDIFPRMLPEFARASLSWLGLAAPVLEAAIGVGLLTERFRSAAVVAALAMHAIILTAIGPFGHNENQVIWPWNLAMIWMVLLLFTGPQKPHPGFWRTPTLAVLLFGVAPALSFVDWMDAYPAFSLYSGNSNAATIYMADSVADRLPEKVQEWVTLNPSKVDELDLSEWSYSELGVPPYAELRIFRNVARQVCAETGNPRELALIVQTRATLFQRRRQVAYGCADLLVP